MSAVDVVGSMGTNENAQSGSSTTSRAFSAAWSGRLAVTLALTAIALSLYALASIPDRRALTSPAPTAPAPDQADRADLAVLTDEVRMLRRQLALALLVQATTSERRPFEAELASAIVAIGTDEPVLRTLDALGPVAPTGAPTRAELAIDLERLALLLRAELAAGRTGIVDRATLVMRDLAVSLGVADKPRASPERILDEVEAARREGRLDVAAEILRRLPPALQRKSLPWMEGLASRQAIEAALGKLQPLLVQPLLDVAPPHA